MRSTLRWWNKSFYWLLTSFDIFFVKFNSVPFVLNKKNKKLDWNFTCIMIMMIIYRPFSMLCRVYMHIKVKVVQQPAKVGGEWQVSMPGTFIKITLNAQSLLILHDMHHDFTQTSNGWDSGDKLLNVSIFTMMQNLDVIIRKCLYQQYLPSAFLFWAAKLILLLLSCHQQLTSFVRLDWKKKENFKIINLRTDM